MLCNVETGSFLRSLHCLFKSVDFAFASKDINVLKTLLQPMDDIAIGQGPFEGLNRVLKLGSVFHVYAEEEAVAGQGEREMRKLALAPAVLAENADTGKLAG